MYTRELLQPPASLIQNGKAVFGTFEGFPAKLDIRGINGPFGGVPLPAFITNFRIKSTLSFNFDIGDFIGCVIFFDAKICGLAEVCLWNKKSGRKYTYKAIMGPRHRFIPHNLNQGFCASFNKHRYIRISWDHTRDRLSMIMSLSGDSVRPSIQAALTGHFSDPAKCEVTHVVPIVSKRRCAASYYSTTKIHGSITLGKTRITPGTTQQNMDGLASLFINRAYYGFQTKFQFISGSGISNGKTVSFILGNTPPMATDPEIINRNILAVDGVFTPLPPVKMTQPYGLGEKWIIQDTENMVDLTFEPCSELYREMNAFIFKSQMYNIYGKFEGVLKTKDGEDIVINGFAGIARDQMLRM